MPWTIYKTDDYAGVLEDRPKVRILVDCREAFTDPQPYLDMIEKAPTLQAENEALKNEARAKDELVQMNGQVLTELHQENERLREALEIYEAALQSIAKPALGGKTQQAMAQCALNQVKQPATREEGAL